MRFSRILKRCVIPLFLGKRAATDLDDQRAWYDSHREAILRGDDGRSGGPESQYSTTTTTAEEVNLWCSSFPNKSKIDYSDGPNGFYATLRQTFDKLVREEHDACEQEDLDAPYFPGFGNPRSGYDDYVKEFYAHWTAFRTSKTFSWVDRYRLSDAPDRRIRRAMEKENKRFRDDAIREFNDAVRVCNHNLQRII